MGEFRKEKPVSLFFSYCVEEREMGKCLKVILITNILLTTIGINIGSYIEDLEKQ